MANYIVKFAPIRETVYTYYVEAEDEVSARLDALDDFRMDVGYDTSKDFECINIEEHDEDGTR